jgi:hypothetical protein
MRIVERRILGIEIERFDNLHPVDDHARDDPPSNDSCTPPPDIPNSMCPGVTRVDDDRVQLGPSRRAVFLAVSIYGTAGRR